MATPPGSAGHEKGAHDSDRSEGREGRGGGGRSTSRQARGRAGGTAGKGDPRQQKEREREASPKKTDRATPPTKHTHFVCNH